jgi:hypothetical protein
MERYSNGGSKLGEAGGAGRKERKGGKSIHHISLLSEKQAGVNA